MAALMAVLVAFKLVETLALIGIIVAAALAWLTSGATLSAIPPLKAIKAEMAQLYDSAKDPIFTALEVLNETAGVVAKVAPGAAEGVATADLKSHWEPPVDENLVSMHENVLPVEDDTFDRLCEEGGRLAGGLALLPISPIVPNAIEDGLKDALGGLTGGMSDWFCGESGGPPPTPPPQPVNKRYPRTDAMDRCRNEELTPDQVVLAAQDPKNFHTDSCDESSADAEAAQPDAQTGECQDGKDCSESGPYEKHAAMAREQCDPTTSPVPYQYSYQTRPGTVTYRYVDKVGWVRGTPEYGQPVFNGNQSRPPCGPASVKPSVAAGYQKTVRAKPGGEVQPVCSDEAAPPLPPLERRDPREISVKFTEVRHVLLCQKSEQEPVEVGDAKAADDSGDPKFPKRVRGDLKLGSEAFQMRVFVRTDRVAARAERAVKLSLWGGKAPEAYLPPGQELRSFAFARAEYFYDGVEAADAWMWNMSWRARLRHFRLPEDPGDRGALWAKAAIAFGKNEPALSGGINLVEAEIAH
jgi:hypothetical protein